MDKNFLKLNQALKGLPMIGNLSASKISYFLLKNKDIATNLINTIKECIKDTKLCKNCNAISSSDICNICSSDSRRDFILVLESMDQLYLIERAGIYLGKYFVLHSLISPLDGIYPKDIKLDTLKSKKPKLIIAILKSGVAADCTNIYLGNNLKVPYKYISYKNSINEILNDLSKLIKHDE